MKALEQFGLANRPLVMMGDLHDIGGEPISQAEGARRQAKGGGAPMPHAMQLLLFWVFMMSMMCLAAGILFPETVLPFLGIDPPSNQMT